MRLKSKLWMPQNFRALVTKKKKVSASMETLSTTDLPKASNIKQMSKTVTGECDTIVKVQYSTINYKDAMVVTGNYPGLKYPMVGGIDMVGKVIETSSASLNIGEEVIMNSFGVGTDHFGGYSELASLQSNWILPLKYSG